MNMSSKSSYDQFSDLSYKHHHSCYTGNNQKQQLHLFTKPFPTENVPTSISKLQNFSEPRQSYLTSLSLNPSLALIMKPKATLSSVNLSIKSDLSQTCLPTITRSGKGKMSLGREGDEKLMTCPSSADVLVWSQRKHLPSPSSNYSFLKSLPSSSSCSIFRRSAHHSPVKTSRCSRSMFTSPCNFLLIIIFYYLVQTSNCECEKSFDAVFCDLPDSFSSGAAKSLNGGNHRSSHSNSVQEHPSALPLLSTSVTSGYGFKSGKIWSLECVSSDEINVFKNSMKPFDLPLRDRYGATNTLSAAISDGETYYLIQNHLVFTANKSEGGGPDLTSLSEPKAAWDIFDDYKGVIRTGFHYKSKLYLYDGSAFHIYTQKSFRRTGVYWSWASAQETSSRLNLTDGNGTNNSTRKPRGNLTSVFTVKSSDFIGEIDIVLIYNHVNYYKFPLHSCLERTQNVEFFLEQCFWIKGPNNINDLFDCIWISWQVLAAIIAVSMIFLLVIGCCCFCFICYRKRRRSGVFRHEKQSCCPDSDHSDCCETEHEPLKTSLSVDQVGRGDSVDGVGCGNGKNCRDGVSSLSGGLTHPSAVNGNGGLSNGSLYHHHHHHIIECGEKDALTSTPFNPSDFQDVESETGSTVGVSFYNEDRLSINLEESKFGKYGPSLSNGCVYNSTTTNKSTSQSNLTTSSQYHHHHIVSNGTIINHNGK